MSGKEVTLTPSELRYRAELLKSLSDFLGVFAFTILMKLRYPNMSDRITYLDLLISEWKSTIKSSRAALSNVFNGSSTFQEDDDEDVKRILSNVNALGDQEFQEAIEHASELVRDTVIRMFERHE